MWRFHDVLCTLHKSRWESTLSAMIQLCYCQLWLCLTNRHSWCDEDESSLALRIALNNKQYITFSSLFIDMPRRHLQKKPFACGCNDTVLTAREIRENVFRAEYVWPCPKRMGSSCSKWHIPNRLDFFIVKELWKTHSPHILAGISGGLVNGGYRSANNLFD